MLVMPAHRTQVLARPVSVVVSALCAGGAVVVADRTVALGVDRTGKFVLGQPERRLHVVGGAVVAFAGQVGYGTPIVDLRPAVLDLVADFGCGDCTAALSVLFERHAAGMRDVTPGTDFKPGEFEVPVALSAVVTRPGPRYAHVDVVGLTEAHHCHREFAASEGGTVLAPAGPMRDTLRVLLTSFGFDSDPDDVIAGIVETIREARPHTDGLVTPLLDAAVLAGPGRPVVFTVSRR